MNHSYLRVIFACTKDINIDNDTVVDAVLNALSSPSINSVNWRTMHKCTCSHTHTHTNFCVGFYSYRNAFISTISSHFHGFEYISIKKLIRMGVEEHHQLATLQNRVYISFFFSQRNVHVYMQRVCVLNFKHAVNYVKYLFNVRAV